MNLIKFEKKRTGLNIFLFFFIFFSLFFSISLVTAQQSEPTNPFTWVWDSVLELWEKWFGDEFVGYYEQRFEVDNVGQEWVVHDGMGGEFNVEFSDKNKQKNEICFWHKTITDKKDLPNKWTIETSEGDVQLNSKQRDGKVGYCRVVDNEVMIKFNPTTVFQDLSMVVLEDNGLQVNNTLKKWNGEEFVIAPEDVWIRDNNQSDNFKFGANDTVASENTTYQYIWESNQEIRQDDVGYYFSSRFSHKTQMHQIWQKNYLDVSDVCIEGANCNFSLVNNTLTMEFIGFYNATLGMVFIDPSYEYTNVSLDATLVDDIHVQAGYIYSHINISNETMGAYFHLDYNDTRNRVAGTTHVGKLREGAFINESGFIGGAFQGDGDDLNLAYIGYSGSMANLRPDGPFTVCAWMYPHNADDLGYGFFGGRDGGGPSSDHYAIGQSDIGSGSWVFRVEVDDSAELVYGGTPVPNNWTHICGVRNVSNYTILYRNGVRSGTSASPIVGNAANNVGPYIGSGYGADPFDGMVDEVMVFMDYAMNDTEIQEIYALNFSKYYTQANQTFTWWNSTTAFGNRTNITAYAEALNGSSLNATIWEAEVGNNTGYISDTDPDVLAYWHFDGDINDSSSYAVTSTPLMGSNITLNTSGIFNNSINFSHPPQPSGFNFTQISMSGAFTFSFWINAYNKGTYQYIMSDATGADAIALRPSDKVLRIRIGNIWHACGSMDLAFGSWHHVAVSRLANDSFTCYQDGAFVQYAGDRSGTFDLKVFGHEGDPNYQTYSNIDEMLIINRSLSAQEIKSLYVTGSTDHRNDGTGIDWTESATGEQELTTYNDTHLQASGYEINNDSTHLLPEFRFYSEPYNYYSPVLTNFTLDTYSVTTAGEDSTPPTFDDIYNITKTTSENVSEDFNASDETGFDCWTVNDTTNFAIDCTGFLTNLTALSAGDQWINVTINDTSNNLNSIEINVSVTEVDETPPYFSTIPNNVTLEYKVDGLGVDFDGADETDFDNYSVNSTTQVSINSSGWLKNITDLPIATHVFNVSINDTSNNWNSTLFEAIVNDTRAPAFDLPLPSNSTLEYKTDGLSVDFDATDLDAVDCFTVDDDTNFTMTCAGVLTNATDLAIGTYELTFVVNDSLNNENTTYYKVTVNDTSPPYFTNNTLVDQTHEYNTDFEYDLNATDRGTFDCFAINDTANFQIDCNGNLTNLTTLDLGVYEINITINDSLNNENTSILNITVQDTAPPSFSTIPANATLERSQDGLGVDFDGTDNYQFDNFTIDDDVNFTINSSGWLKNLTDLEVGTYVVNVTINDTSNNLNETLYEVVVNDTSPPYFTNNTVTDQTHEYNDAFEYDLNASDRGTFDCFAVNDTTNFQIDCNGNLTNLTTLSIKVHELNITINDSYNNENTTILNITVQDTIKPVIDDIHNVTINEDESVVTYYNASDPSGLGNWSLNDTTYFIMNDTGSLKNHTGLSVGVYWVNVTVNDTQGNEEGVDVNITVQSSVDSTPPYFSTIPNNVTLEYKVDGLGVDFDGTDETSFDNYSVNSTTQVTINSSGWLSNITDLPVATHVFNITINDTSNNVNSTLYQVTVQDTTVPVIDDIHNVSIDDDESVNADFNASDTGDFDCWAVNDTTNFAIDCTGQLTNVTGLGSDVIHWINLTVNDSVNNLASIVIFVNVTNTTLMDMTPPYFTTIPANATLEYKTDGLGVDFDGADETSFGTFTVNSTGLFEINDSGWLKNITDLEVATHVVNITINDSSNNVNSTLYQITVEDTTPPTLTTFNPTIYTNQSLDADFNATDLSAVDTFVVNDTINFAIDGSGSLSNVTGLAIGTYYKNISVNDSYNNWASAVVTINVNNESVTAAAVTQAQTCKYKKFGYYNVKLPWFREANCV